jgi:hypothetical protein
MTAQAHAPATPLTEPTPPPSRPWTGLPLLVEALAVLPLLAMLRDVLRAPHMPYLDYWHILFNETTVDGSLDLSNIMVPPNQQPQVLPGLIFYLNAVLFGGDNRVLGCFVVALVAVTLLVLRSLLPRTLPRLVRALFVPFAAALLYSGYGMHNFIAAMSGSSFLLADLMAVTAILCAARGRYAPAMLLALVASFTHGSAYALWPMLVMIVWVRRAAIGWRIVPIVAGIALPSWWFTVKPLGQQGMAPTDEPAAVLFTALSALGLVFTGGNALLGVLAAAVLLGAVVLLLGVRSLRTEPAALAWWAVCGYAVLCCVMVGITRHDFGIDGGAQGRYASMSGLAWIALAVLVVMAATTVAQRTAPAPTPARPLMEYPRQVEPPAPPRQLPVAPVAAVLIAVALAVQALGFPMGNDARKFHERENVIAVAVRAGVPDGFGFYFEPADDLVPRLRALGHYPFTAGFTLGCRGPELGDVVDTDGIADGNPGAEDAPFAVGAVDTAQRTGSAVQLKGWAHVAGTTPRCAVVVDDAGVVVGGGQVGQLRPDVAATGREVTPRSGFWLVAPASSGADPAAGLRVLVIGTDDRRFLLDPPREDDD